MFERLKNKLRGLLRRSESYTRTDMLYVTQAGFWLSLARGVGLLSSLIFAVAMANLVPPEVFGTYKFVISAASIISAVSLAGLGVAITQAVARGYEGALRSGRNEYFKWSFGVIGISIAGAVYYFLNDNYTLAVSFLIIGSCTPIITGFSFFTQFLSGKRGFRTFSIYDTLRNVMPALVLIMTVFLTSDPVLIILVFFVSSAITNVLLYYSTIQKYRPNDTTDPKTIPYARHLSLLGVMGKVAEHIDKILIFHYLGAAQLALYAFAQTPINNLKLLNDIPAKLALPKLSQRNFSELRRSLPRKVFLLMGIMALVVISYILLAPLFFKILFPKYLGSVIFTQVLALSLIFAPGSMFGEALTAHMKKKELYFSQAVLPIARIGLLLLLLPPFGLWGAVGVIIVSQLLMFILNAFQFLRAKTEIL